MTIDPTQLQSAAKVAESLVAIRANTSAARTTQSSAASGSSTITSNDFLSLLVTEMKNQDPTQPTDPNAYIQQMVGVNSLQQLIAINQDLTSPASPPTSTSATSSSGPASVNAF